MHHGLFNCSSVDGPWAAPLFHSLSWYLPLRYISCSSRSIPGRLCEECSGISSPVCPLAWAGVWFLQGQFAHWWAVHGTRWWPCHALSPQGCWAGTGYLKAGVLTVLWVCTSYPHPCGSFLVSCCRRSFLVSSGLFHRFMVVLQIIVILVCPWEEVSSSWFHSAILAGLYWITF